MKEIENLVKAERALARESMIYQLLGQFGDRLPKDVQDEMIKEAEFQNQLRKKFKNKLR